jgi:hypothetical protein
MAASPVASASFRYLAIIFGLYRYLAASKVRALGIRSTPFAAAYFPFAFNPSLKIRILFFSHVRTMKYIATPFRDHNQNKNKPRNEK